MEIKKRFKRICKDCEKYYIPTGKYQKYCDKCLKKPEHSRGSYNKDKIKRKVVCVFGKWGDKSDFVLEPVCFETCNCELCRDAFWIEGEKKC